MPNNSRLVYSTDGGRIKPSKENKKVAPQTQTLPQDGVVRIHRESKGRKGKGVCIVKGLLLSSDELKQLAKQLKQLCGTGGAVKNDCIEIQGDNRDKLKQALEKQGYLVKLAGS